MDYVSHGILSSYNEYTIKQYDRKIFPTAAAQRQSNTSGSRKAFKRQRAALEGEEATWAMYRPREIPQIIPNNYLFLEPGEERNFLIVDKVTTCTSIIYSLKQQALVLVDVGR